jgi:3-hydroxyisobutyrate dehydrogenase-like beta-hydroxyacid dehydrogenase
LKIAVVGLGALGCSLSESLVKANFSVVGWNRSGSGKTSNQQVDLNATIAQCEIIISALSGATTFQEVFASPERRALLSGKTVISFTSATPADTEHQERWLKGCGAPLIDAKFYGVPAMLGANESTIYHSGPTNASIKKVLSALAPSRLIDLGPKVGIAAAIDAAVLSAFYSAMVGFSYGRALCKAYGIQPSLFDHAATGIIDAKFIEYLADAFDESGRYRAEAKVDVYTNVHVKAVEMLADCARESQLDAKLFGVVRRLFTGEV